MTEETAVVAAPLAESAELLAGLTALRQTLAPTLTDAELALFALIAKRKGLDPFSGQIVAVKRNTRNGPRVSYQTGIDGFRSLAERTGGYLGSDLPDFGPPCGCGKAPEYHPEWATVTVHRLHASGRVVDQPARAKWHEFVPSDAFMWGEKPEVMIGKCAEAQALRKAFPWVLGDIYIPEEMVGADEADATSAGPALTARETVAARAAAIRGDPPPEEQPEATGTGELNVEPELQTSEPRAMTAPEFGTAIDALGTTRERVRARAEELFPGRSAMDMSPRDWGRLYDELAAEGHPDAS